MCTVKDPVASDQEFVEHTLKMMRNCSNVCNHLDRELISSAVEGNNEKYQNIVQQLNKLNKQMETLQQTMLAVPNQIVQAMNQFRPMGVVTEQQRTMRPVTEIEKWICEMSMSPTSSLSSSYSDDTLERDFERLNFDVEDKEEIEANETMTTTTATAGLNKHAPASKLFAHWQQQYNTTQNSGQGSKFLFGSFVPASPPATTTAAAAAAHSSTLLSSTTAPKILPYNANIDLSVWLK